MQQVSERHRKMEDQYREVCSLFCENPKTTEPSEFFKSFHKFIEAYKNAERELERQITEDETIKKAQRIQKQNEKTRKSAAANARLAAEVVSRRRRSELIVDQNDNHLMMKHQRPMSSAISLNDSGTQKFSLSYPRSGSMERLLDKCDDDTKETNNKNDELMNNPLFKRTSKLFSDSDPDILDDKKIDRREDIYHGISASKSLTLPISPRDHEQHFRDRSIQIDSSPTSPVSKKNGNLLFPPSETSA